MAVYGNRNSLWRGFSSFCWHFSFLGSQNSRSVNHSLFRCGFLVNFCSPYTRAIPQSARFQTADVILVSSTHEILQQNFSIFLEGSSIVTHHHKIWIRHYERNFVHYNRTNKHVKAICIGYSHCLGWLLATSGQSVYCRRDHQHSVCRNHFQFYKDYLRGSRRKLLSTGNLPDPMP